MPVHASNSYGIVTCNRLFDRFHLKLAQKSPLVPLYIVCKLAPSTSTSLNQSFKIDSSSTYGDLFSIWHLDRVAANFLQNLMKSFIFASTLYKPKTMIYFLIFDFIKYTSGNVRDNSINLNENDMSWVVLFGTKENGISSHPYLARI